MNKILIAGLILSLISISVFAFNYFENKNPNECNLNTAQEMLNFTLPYQEKYCKQLGGNPFTLIVREENDLNTPIIIPICLRNEFVEPAEGVN